MTIQYLFERCRTNSAPLIAGRGTHEFSCHLAEIVFFKDDSAARALACPCLAAALNQEIARLVFGFPPIPIRYASPSLYWAIESFCLAAFLSQYKPSEGFLGIPRPSK